MNRILSRRYVPYLAAGGVTASLAACYFPREKEREIIGLSGWPAYLKHLTPDVFQVRGNTGEFCVGKEMVWKHLLLSEEEYQKELMVNEKSTTIARKGNMVVKYDTVSIAANTPTEDRWKVDLIPRGSLSKLFEGKFWPRWADVKQETKKDKDEEKGKEVYRGDGRDDLMFFSMIDGHAGVTMPDLLQRVLHPTLAFALAQSEGLLHRASNKLSLTSTDHTLTAIRDVIKALDDDILSKPLALFNNTLKDPHASSFLPSPAPGLMQLATLDKSGACFSTVIIDIAKDKLYVANLGDCRAVAGWWNPESGQYRCDVLTIDGDGNAQNPVEAERIRNEHPDSEREDVIADTGFGVRVLGGGEMTRSIGDPRYKRTAEEKEDLTRVLGSYYYPFKKPCLTVPYVSNEPEVLARDLHPDNGEQLKFLILATDGLWGSISSEEATLLVSAQLALQANESEFKYKGAIPKSILPMMYPQTKTVESRPYPAEDLPGTTPKNSQGDWDSKDHNLATHLVRNGLGRGDDWESRHRLSMRPPDARRFRDDTSVMVVVFDEVDDAPPDSVSP